MGGVDWSTVTLQQTIEGHWVKVRGWLMFDSEHKSQAENTHPGGTQFPLEDGDGQPSRWNTLRALRVLDWYDAAR